MWVKTIEHYPENTFIPEVPVEFEDYEDLIEFFESEFIDVKIEKDEDIVDVEIYEYDYQIRYEWREEGDV